VAPLDPKVVACKRAATDDPEKFWGEAAEALPWFKTWERVLPGKTFYFTGDTASSDADG
jgi:hypothetical protein